MITDAGKLVPGYSLLNDGVEFFVHSPFAIHVDGELIDRNESSLILHATFEYNGVKTRLMLIGDLFSPLIEFEPYPLIDIN
ncbi:hypothetical protein Pmgp_03834 [Pelotomaculum propionicicum]|uniref:Uncharacterized protein n=1 Tax=Pelotomaculum propionicicum TaxID=258475 RepID=A0A4Y7R903_9FIRM|nr:hypothetical protein Pmgp_03834 [Pelotomaculum propionicicum]